MIELNFTLSEFNISGDPIPEKVADKILKHHILPMQIVRNNLNTGIHPDEIKIFPSQKSGFRPHSWEIKNGRSGKSQHTFGQKKSGKIFASELGAVDWTCTKFGNYWELFLDEIIENTDYTRIAVYNTFIHCDYKKTASGRRELYSSTPDSKWSLQMYIKEEH